jgi:hypothetical protein
MQARQRNIFSKRVNVRSVCGGSVVGVTCLGRAGDHHLPLLRFHLRKKKNIISMFCVQKACILKGLCHEMNIFLKAYNLK